MGTSAGAPAAAGSAPSAGDELRQLASMCTTAGELPLHLLDAHLNYIDRRIRDLKLIPETRAERRYTRNLDFAKRLVPANCSWAVGNCGEDDGPWACVTANGEDQPERADCPDYEASGVTPSVALAAAALLARAAGEPIGGSEEGGAA